LRKKAYTGGAGHEQLLWQRHSHGIGNGLYDSQRHSRSQQLSRQPHALEPWQDVAQLGQPLSQPPSPLLAGVTMG
jgi:hypothetical protein